MSALLTVDLLKITATGPLILAQTGRELTAEENTIIQRLLDEQPRTR